MLGKVYYGYYVAAALFLFTALAVGGVAYSFGVFITALEEEFGWTRTQINVSLSFFAVGGLLSPFLGNIMDRIGTRPLIAVSLTLVGTSFLLRPLMTQLWHFYALSILQYATFAGAAILPSGKLIGVWFQRTRGRMMGLTTMGANFGGFLFSGLSGLLIGAVGWEVSYIVIGLLFLAVVPIALLVIREGPSALDRLDADRASSPESREAAGLTVRQAVRTRAFYVLALGLLGAAFTYQAVLTQIVPHLQNQGISLARAATALSVIALFGMAGKVIFGYMTERMPARYALGIDLAVQISGLLILVIAASSPLVWLFVPVYGLGLGGLGSIIPLIVHETFGLRAFGGIFGLVNMATLGASFIGPPLVGLAFDLTGGYDLAFLGVAAVFAASGVIVSLARPPSWSKVEEVPATNASSIPTSRLL